MLDEVNLTLRGYFLRAVSVYTNVISNAIMKVLHLIREVQM